MFHALEPDRPQKSRPSCEPVARPMPCDREHPTTRIPLRFREILRSGNRMEIRRSRLSWQEIRCHWRSVVHRLGFRGHGLSSQIPKWKAIHACTLSRRLGLSISWKRWSLRRFRVGYVASRSILGRLGSIATVQCTIRCWLSTQRRLPIVRQRCTQPRCWYPGTIPPIACRIHSVRNGNRGENTSILRVTRRPAVDPRLRGSQRSRWHDARAANGIGCE